jgi:hypothetical protein
LPPKIKRTPPGSARRGGPWLKGKQSRVDENDDRGDRKFRGKTAPDMSLCSTGEIEAADRLIKRTSIKRLRPSAICPIMVEWTIAPMN